LARIAVAFDYDGVLVDSYRGISVFYTTDLPALAGVSIDYARQLMYVEYLSEGIGLLRESIWPRYIPGYSRELFDELITRYWERRIEYSVILPGVTYALKKLRKEGIDIYHVGYMDDIYGLKEYRIEADGLAGFFKGIYIVGENTSSRASALKEILEQYDIVVYIDDKPVNLMVIEHELRDFIDRIKLVRHVFKSVYEAPWFDPVGRHTAVRNLFELLQLTRKLVREDM